MRSTGFLFSLILHVTVVLAAVFWSGLGSVNVDLNQAVYKVDLVSLAAPGPARKAPEPQKAPTAPPAAEPAPQKPVEQPAEAAQPKPVPAPEVPVPEAAKPRPVEAKPQPRKTPPKPEAKPVAEKVEKKPEPKKSEPPKPEKKPEPKPEPKKPPQPSPESVLANALKSVETDVQKQQKKEAQDLNRELASLRKESGDIYETGAEEGSEAGGGGGGLSEVFSAIVGQQIKQHWRWPDYASDSNLVCVVEITIDGQGVIMDSRVARSSGRPEFDTSALRAVKETEQVAQPPARRLQKVLINFNSQELMQ